MTSKRAKRKKKPLVLDLTAGETGSDSTHEIAHLPEPQKVTKSDPTASGHVIPSEPGRNQYAEIGWYSHDFTGWESDGWDNLSVLYGVYVETKKARKMAQQQPKANASSLPPSKSASSTAPSVQLAEEKTSAQQLAPAPASSSSPKSSPAFSTAYSVPRETKAITPPSTPTSSVSEQPASDRPEASSLSSPTSSATSQKRAKAAPLLCSMCDKQFKSPQRLATHRATHSRKLYFCPHCSKTYKRKGDMARHLATAHEVFENTEM